MMIRAAQLIAEGRRIPGIAGAATVEPSWEPVARRIRDEATDDWDDRVAVERFESKGGHFRRGQGRLVGPGRVAVGDEVIEAARAVVIATGTEPAVPPVPGLADVAYWTNREAIETKEAPASLVVMGGGAVGLELAQVFRRFGSEVSVVEAVERLLPLEEPAAGELVARVFEREGIAVRTGVKVDAVRAEEDRLVAELGDGTALSGQRLLVATGRRADLAGLGVASVGLDDQARFIEVDEHLRAVPGVWAVGDVTGKGNFTHVAMYQAGLAVADILGRDGPPADYKALQDFLFRHIAREAGRVGLAVHIHSFEGAGAFFRAAFGADGGAQQLQAVGRTA